MSNARLAEAPQDAFGLRAAMRLAEQGERPVQRRLVQAARLGLFLLALSPIVLTGLLLGKRVVAGLSPFETWLLLLLGGWALLFLLYQLRADRPVRRSWAKLWAGTGSAAARPGSVAVIGAGPVGLAVVKECLAQSVAVTCFERKTDLGGVYLYTEAFEGGVWKSARLTTSPWITAFSDFPPESPDSKHYSHEQYVAYLGRYAERFGLRPHIRFGTTVETLRPAEDGGWDVGVVTDGSPDVEWHHVDRVAVCAGLNLFPKDVKIPGMEEFAGEISHVASYKGPEGFAGKSVVVVGNGESGTDVAEEMSRHADRAILCMRRGTFVIPRMNPLNGVANDYDTNRLRYATPVFVRDAFMRLMRRLCVWAGEVDPPAALRAQLLETSEAGPMSQTVTKADDFLEPILEGRLDVRPAISALEGDTVTFADGSRAKADHIVFAHGYQPRFPFLELPGSVGMRHPGLMYLNMFHPDLGDGIAFCGFARPALGTIPPTGELQARLLALIAAGRRRLPERAHMEAHVVRSYRINGASFPTQLQPNVVVSWIPYMDELAELVGCRPSPWRLLLRPRLFWKAVSGPVTGAFYRLSGPGRAAVAETTVLTLPRMHGLMEMLTLVGLHFWLWPAALLSRKCRLKPCNRFL